VLFGVSLGALWYQFCVNLWSAGASFGTVCGQVGVRQQGISWVPIGVQFRSVWHEFAKSLGDFEVSLEWVWIDFEPRPLWGQFGVGHVFRTTAHHISFSSAQLQRPILQFTVNYPSAAPSQNMFCIIHFVRGVKRWLEHMSRFLQSISHWLHTCSSLRRREFMYKIMHGVFSALLKL